MVLEKHRKELVKLALVGLGYWIITTFSFMCLWWIKGGLADPPAQQVSASLYDTAVEFSRLLVFVAIPVLTLGYLLFALSVLRLAEKINGEQSSGVRKWSAVKYGLGLGAAVGLTFVIAYWGSRFEHGEFRTNASDTELRQRAVGTWSQPGRGTITYAANGHFTSAWTNFNATPPKAWAYEGTWEITNKTCVTTSTNVAWNATNDTPVRSVERWRIIRLDDNKIVLSLNGQTVSLGRSK